LSYSSSHHAIQGVVVWAGKPWVTPAAIVRTATLLVFAVLFLMLEMYGGVAITILGGLPLYVWTLAAFAVIWVASMLELLLFWASSSYVLRQDGLEIRRGIIRLNSFVVTPSGFGDLIVFQSLAGRIFGYGDLTVNSQGERETRLRLVQAPFATADTIRDIMGKPIVRVEAPIRT
jgi:uncharacterized membrane protein YdbT with pleckstrin-like domain